MKILKSSLVFVLVTCALYAQNLVPNPNFENFSTCPTMPGQIAVVNSWTSVQGSNDSPDYFHTCSSPSLVGVPMNYAGVETPASGNAYVGLVQYWPSHPGGNVNYREYIMCQLITPLQAGVEYAVRFKYSLSDNSMWSSSAFGIYFSNTMVTGPGPNNPLPVTPQLMVTTQMNQQNGWEQIDFTYTATGGEQWMVMGNFLDHAMSTPLSITLPTASRRTCILFF